MSQAAPKRGRPHNAEGAREAILNAAEAVFAEHGFDGARVDSIAEVAGYNKSLLFQYFGDKLGLYVEVIKRADHATRDLQLQPIAWLAGDEAALSPDGFAVLLKRFIAEVFDFYLEHPRLARILVWEMAEGWNTYTQMAARLDTSEFERLGPLLETIKQARLLHSDFDPLTQVTLAEFVAIVFLACIPMFQVFLPTEGLPAPEALARARAFVVDFIARGLLANPPQPKTEEV